MSVTFLNARFGANRFGSLRVHGSRIAAIDSEPHGGDVVVDLQGDRLLPGLINSHDHLQLNSLPAHEPPGFYRHARDWVWEIDARRRTDPQFEAGVAVARDVRLLLGAIKNLLSGVTTVAHHDPLYPYLARSDFPISVVHDYGWAHSLYIDGEQAVAASYRATPAAWPWIIHAAEGVNDEAADEFDRLDALGCVKPNTLLVHGIALDQARRTRLKDAAAGLIWCPSSNMRLFGRTAMVKDLILHARVALGTDSRLSGAHDLFAELRLASELSGLDEEHLQRLVTCDSAGLLRLADRGALRPGLRADLLVLPAQMPLSKAARAAVRLVMVGGVARYGDADCAMTVSPHNDWANVAVDGVRKVLDRNISRLLADARAGEPGLDISEIAGHAA